MRKSFALVLFSLVALLSLSGCSKLDLDYEFNSGQSFTAIQGAFGNKDAVSYKGYMYYFSAEQWFGTYPWTTATLHSPAAINGGNDASQCWFQEEGKHKSLDFYCGGSATNPAKPPEGTYLVNVGSNTYTFNGMTSRTIDAAINDVFVPVIKLTMDGSGKITLVEWQWWKKSAGVWAQPSNSEVASAMEYAGFETSSTGWVGDRVNGEFTLTSTGSVVPSTQSFTPGVFRVSYYGKDGYSYGFEWY